MYQQFYRVKNEAVASLKKAEEPGNGQIRAGSRHAIYIPASQLRKEGVFSLLTVITSSKGMDSVTDNLRDR